jgi:hypothetical protein
MLFKNSVRTSKRTPHVTITEINWLTLFKEIIAVYSENHTKPTDTKYSITDCQDSQDIQFPACFKGLMTDFKLLNEGRKKLFSYPVILCVYMKSNNLSTKFIGFMSDDEAHSTRLTIKT